MQINALSKDINAVSGIETKAFAFQVQCLNHYKLSSTLFLTEIKKSIQELHVNCKYNDVSHVDETITSNRNCYNLRKILEVNLVMSLL